MNNCTAGELAASFCPTLFRSNAGCAVVPQFAQSPKAVRLGAHGDGGQHGRCANGEDALQHSTALCGEEFNFWLGFGFIHITECKKLM